MYIAVSLVESAVHCEAAVGSDRAGHSGQQCFGGAGLGVGECRHLFEAVLEAESLAVLAAEGLEDLSLVLGLHLRVVERGVELRVQLLPHEQLLLRLLLVRLLLRLQEGRRHLQSLPQQALPVHLRDCLRRLIRVGELDESVTLGYLGGAVGDDLAQVGRGELGAEELEQLVLSDRGVEIAHVDLDFLRGGLAGGLSGAVCRPVEFEQFGSAWDSAVVVVLVEAGGAFVGLKLQKAVLERQASHLVLDDLDAGQFLRVAQRAHHRLQVRLVHPTLQIAHPQRPRSLAHLHILLQELRNSLFRTAQPHCRNLPTAFLLHPRTTLQQFQPLRPLLVVFLKNTVNLLNYGDWLQSKCNC